MLSTIADHIKTHRHQLRQHALFIGSGVIIPPRDLSVQQLIADMAVEWAGEQVAGVPQELRADKALSLMAEAVPDHARRCRMLAQQLSDCRPAEGHIRLARMIKDGYFSTIFLAEPDRLLEEALQVHHLTPEKDYHHFVVGVDDAKTIRVGVEESSRMTIVKCCGDVNTKLLPLTGEEIAAAYADIRDIIAATFKIFTVIVAYEERDRPVLEHISRDGRRIFWINPVVPVGDQRHYDELKVESPTSVRYHRYQPQVTELLSARASSRHLICREAGTFNEFMARLHDRLTRRRRSERRRRDLTLLRGGPYRFLDRFDVEDAEFFFGREEDTRILIQMIESNQLVILFGRSGIGKTSLLCAGVMASLAEKSEEAGADEEGDLPWLGVYSRCLDDPTKSIKEATIAAVEDIGYEAEGLDEEGSLLEFIRSVHAVTNRRILIVMDQFEEYFARLGDHVRAQFMDGWTECLDAGLHYLHWAVGIREDFVGELHDLHSRIPSVMHSMYRLKKLSREQAKDAIVKPAQNFDIHIEGELVDVLLEDLSREGIEPAQLQIVCDRLYEAKPAGQHTIALHTYEQLGSAERILSDYLDFALSQFTVHERRVARAILKHMVSSSEVLAISPIERIAEQLGYGRDEIERVLARLVDFRLLRGVGEERRKRYELVHEYLTDEIEDWMSDTEIGVKDVQDLIARELNNYREFGLLIHSEELKIINDGRESLSLSPEELELILRSTAQRGEEVAYWFGRIDELGDEQVPLLKSLLNADDHGAKQIAADAIARAPSIDYLPELIALLECGDRQLAAKATKTLADLERALINLLGSSDNAKQVLAVRALGAIKSHRAIPRLMGVIATADDALRDAVADALVALEEPAAHDMLLRRMASRDGISWPGAYTLAVIAAQDDEALAKLGRQVARFADSAKAQYALGLLNIYTHQLDKARQQLEMAASMAAGDPEGEGNIAAAMEELAAEEAKLAEGTEVWHCFQCDKQHTGRSRFELQPPLKQLWSFETKGPVLGSPVVSGGLVYIGSRDGNLYAVDAVRGTQQWKLQTGDQIEATPAISGKLVCVGSHDGVVYAADTMGGAVQWKTRLGNSIRSSPVLADGRLFVGDHAGNLTALAVETGGIIWNTATRGEITASPAIAGEIVIVGSWDGEIYAFDAADGSLRWTCSTAGPVASTPTVQGEYVCCGSDDANVYALAVETGEIVWKRPVGGYTRSSAAATEDLFIIGCHDGRVYALDHDTGEVVWRAETEDEILASAAICGGLVYLGSIDGALYAMELDSGKIVWKHETLYGIYSSPAIVGDMLYIGIEHYYLAAFTTTDDETT